MSLGNDGGIPAVMNVTPTGTISSGSGGMGWGNDGSWWIIILFLFIFAGGWNRNGWGGNGNGATPSGSGAIDNYVLASDFAQVERKLDTVRRVCQPGNRRWRPMLKSCARDRRELAGMQTGFGIYWGSECGVVSCGQGFPRGKYFSLA